MPTYTASTATIPNPERGFFQYTETHYQNDLSGYSALSSSTLATSRTTDSRTVVFRYFVMERFLTRDTLDSAWLTLVAADLQAIRDAGCKAVIRFTYSTAGNISSPPYAADPPVARVLGHITQLASTINAHADVVYAVQAGFIGMWGEWYYTDNFGDTGTLNSTNWTDRTSVLNGLLDALDTRIFVLVRYPGVKLHIYGDPASDPRAARVGFHNDAFLADFEDFGTYTTFTSLSASATRAYVAAQTGAIPNGGESAATNGTHSQWASAVTDLAAYHWTFLNPLYHPDVLASWTTGNKDEAARNLGYRLRLTSSTLPSTVAAGGSYAVSLDITNDGYSAPNSARPVQIVFVGATTVVRDLTADPRTWLPGSRTVSGTVTAPPSAGTYAVHLRIPDPTTGLQATPAYSIQLANTGVWDGSTGRNDLGQAVTVTAAADTAAPSVPSGLSAASITATTFTLNWTASTDDTAVTGYDVYKGGVLLGSPTSNTYPVTGLTAATAYSMTVRAKDAAGNNSAQSSALSVTTAAAPDTTAPTVPTGLAASSVTTTTLTLTWSASTDGVGVTSYEVRQGGTPIGTPSGTSFDVTGLIAGSFYAFTVAARDGAGNTSAASTPLTVTTASGGTPMTRSTYGGTLADYGIDGLGRPQPLAVYRVWSSPTGGTQLTDLLTMADAVATTAVADDQGFIRFKGPDGVAGELWLEAADGDRFAVRPTDLADTVDAIAGIVGDGSSLVVLDGGGKVADSVVPVTVARTANVVGKGTLVLDVHDYWVSDDGSDWQPAFKRAMLAAHAAGGGDVLAVGDFTLVTQDRPAFGNPITSTSFLFTTPLRNVRIVGAGKGSTRIYTDAARLFWFSSPGPASPLGIPTAYPMNPAAKGATTITLTTAADASHFTPGDVIFFRTGNCSGASAGPNFPVGTPDSEFADVVSVNTGTGTLTLRHPLVSAYRTEYFNPGEDYSSGTTSTTNTGTASAMDVRRMSDVMHKNFGLLDMTIEMPNSYFAIVGDCLDGLELSGVRYIGYGGFQSMSAWRRGLVHGQCEFHMTGPAFINGTVAWWLSTAFGCSDVEIRDSIFTAANYAWLHINEGSKRIRVHDNTFQCAPGFNTNNQSVVSLGTRGYAIDIHDNYVQNPSLSQGGAGIRVNAPGPWEEITIDNNTVYGGYAGVIDVSPNGDCFGPNNYLVAQTTYGRNYANSRPGLSDRLWLSAQDFFNLSAVAVTSAAGTPIHNAAAAGTTQLCRVAKIPKAWLSVRVYVHWATASASPAGAVQWEVRAYDYTPGLLLRANVQGNAFTSATVVAPVGAQLVVVRSELTTSSVPLPLTSGVDDVMVQLRRLGDNSGDTSTDLAAFVGVEIVPFQYRSR